MNNAPPNRTLGEGGAVHDFLEQCSQAGLDRGALEQLVLVNLRAWHQDVSEGPYRPLAILALNQIAKSGSSEVELSPEEQAWAEAMMTDPEYYGVTRDMVTTAQAQLTWAEENPTTSDHVNYLLHALLSDLLTQLEASPTGEAPAVEDEPTEEAPDTLTPRTPAPPSRLRPWLRRALVGMLALGTPCLGVATPFALQKKQALEELWASMQVRGDHLAEEAVREARIKNIVEVRAKDGTIVGYMRGAMVGVEVEGGDSSIPSFAGDFEPGGQLYPYGLGLMMLEDQDHDARYSTYGWSDRYGVSPTMFFTMASGRGGGSTIADQACGALRDGLTIDWVVDEQREYWGYWRDRLIAPFDKIPWVDEHTQLDDHRVGSLQERACGIAMSTKYSPSEILAFQASHTYFGPQAKSLFRFAQKYWGFPQGIYDERFDVGHQLVAAALPNIPWNPNKADVLWPQIESRAKLAADRLIERGAIPVEMKTSVYAQIEAARPLDAHAVSNDVVVTRPGFELAMQKAVLELREVLGDHFKADLRVVTLALDETLQNKLVQAAQNAEAKVNSETAHPIGMIIDEHGALLALYVDDQVLSRLWTEINMGSLGKVFLAAGVAFEGLTQQDGYKFEVPEPDTGTGSPEPTWVYDPLTEAMTLVMPEPVEPVAHYNPLESFAGNLRDSRRAIISDAQALGVSETFVEGLVGCYGSPSEAFERDPLKHVALGNYGLSPYGAVMAMHDAVTGVPTPRLHVVESYTLTDGTVVSMNGATDPALELSRLELSRWDLSDTYFTPESCADAMYQKGVTADWLTLPLKGTGKEAAGEFDWLKTGTTCTTGAGQGCADDGTNSRVFTVGATRRNGRVYTGVFGVMSDKPTEPVSQRGQTSMNVAAPMAAEAFSVLEENPPPPPTAKKKRK